MRKYTLVVSLLAHVGAVLAILVVTITATDMLPPVRRAVDFITVTAPPAPPPPPVRRIQRDVPVATNAAPVDAPRGISEERPPDPIELLPSPGDLVISDLAGPPPVVEAPPPPPALREPIRVGGGIQPPRKVASPPPVYPPIARAAHVEGVVILEAVVAEDGTVRDVRPLRSIPLLDQAAIDAVKHWRFTPTLLNGEPIAVVMTVTVSFALR